MNEKEYVYAIHKEGPFNYDDEKEVIATLLEWRWQDETYEGFRFYRGEKIGPKASTFLDAKGVIENMHEEACGETHEYGCDWLEDITPEQITDLKAYVDAWADKHNLQPTFYKVENIEELKVTVSIKKAELAYEQSKRHSARGYDSRRE